MINYFVLYIYQPGFPGFICIYVLLADFFIASFDNGMLVESLHSNQGRVDVFHDGKSRDRACHMVSKSRAETIAQMAIGIVSQARVTSMNCSLEIVDPSTCSSPSTFLRNL
jgi:hypothetical protein